jgi:flagellar basal-body rod modification protein FlgD
MTDPISGMGSTTSATTSVTRPDQMDKDVFLQLLVAQMRYQDPNNPTSTTEFMSQTATFTQIEKLEQMVAQNAAMLSLQRSASAGALVGHVVAYTDETGQTQIGAVNSVRLATDTDEAVAYIGGVAIPVARITEISHAATPVTDPAQPPAAGTPAAS